MGRVDFLSYPFIIAYPFIREVKVPNGMKATLVKNIIFNLLGHTGCYVIIYMFDIYTK